MTNLRQAHFAQTLLARAQTMSDRRVATFDLNGQRYWLKRPEQVSGLRRLQKGDGQQAFRREINLLKSFQRKGAPVVPILAEEPGLVVMPDMGPALNVLASTVPDDEFATILQSAAIELAALHAKGMAHGRPRLRDICWDGTRICFLDLEAGAQINASRKARAMDLLLLVHSVHHQDVALAHHIPALLGHYAQQDQAHILPEATHLVRRLSLLRPLIALVAGIERKRGKSRSEAISALAVLDNFTSYKMLAPL